MIGGIALTNEAIQALERMGWRARAVPIERVDDLRRGLEHHHREGRISDGSYREFCRWFKFEPPSDLPDARSVLVVSTPCPRVVFHVHWRGRRVPMHLPPTYSEIDSSERQKLELLNSVLRPAGYAAVGARLPAKALAVHSGLASYGRNNITYVPDFGSFHHLDAFYSNAPCESDPWGEPRLMDRCETCNACKNSCPTQAIHDDWMIIRAERCLCNLNERGGEFPDWVDPSWHDSIIGCFHCQQVCPENSAMLGRVAEGPDFSQDEVAAILRAKSVDDVSPAILEKLRSLGLHFFMHAIARNMRVLLEQAGATVA